MQVGFRRLAQVAVATVATASIVVWATATWVWSNALDTDTYVGTANVALEQPDVQSAIAGRIVDSIVGDADIPDEITALLDDGARFVVASRGFAVFWEQAQRGMHEILRRQVLDDVAPAQMSARITLTPEVDAVLQRLREMDPGLARYLPASTPEVVIEVADAERLADIKSAVDGLDRLSTATAWSSVVLLVLAALLSGFRRRSATVVAVVAALSAVLVYGVAVLVPAFASRLADDTYAAAADAVAGHMATGLTTRSWQLVAFSVAAVVAAFFPMRSLRRATREDERA